MLRNSYSHFLNANPDRLHFAAHSHHYWPDCTRQAHLEYWDLSARLADHKWEYIFSKVVPDAQKHIAGLLNVDDPSLITFAPNTHEFVARLLSCFSHDRPLRILTTDSEFHSFSRQVDRYGELPHVEIDRVSVEPLTTFSDRFIKQATQNTYDFVFVSHVFFNSGFIFDGTKNLVKALQSSDSVIVVDGYHAFCAIPIDLSEISSRIFYIAGGYKYAQSGEGACFMLVPPNCTLRPLDTGWFANFSHLEDDKKTHSVSYDKGGNRFWGSTFDPSGLFRFNAVMDWWKRDAISVQQIHQHVVQLQQSFVNGLAEIKHPSINQKNLMNADLLQTHQGHFLTFKTLQAKKINDELNKLDVIVDYRADRLRFGFGAYHTAADIEVLLNKIKQLSK
jgi:selenocysteine lyase/cysteine desulfurase